MKDNNLSDLDRQQAEFDEQFKDEHGVVNEGAHHDFVHTVFDYWDKEPESKMGS